MALRDQDERGWTDQYPHKSDAGDEYYFVRRKDRADVVVMGFSMGKGWLNGVSYEQSEMRSHLFLGPLHPSDFEQLVRLRKAAGDALDWIEASLDYDDLAMDGRPIMAALREALGEK